MQVSSRLSLITLAQLRAWVVAVLIFSLATGVAAAAPPNYSTNNQYAASDPYQVGLLGAESGVQYPERAADADLSNLAVLNTAIGVASTTSLKLGLSGTGGAAGDRARVLVSTAPARNNPLNLNILSRMILRTYAGAQLQETRVVSADVARAILLSGDRPTQLEFAAKLPFTAAELEVGGVATASYKRNILYAYAVPSLVQPQAKGVLSRFAGSDLTPCYGAGTSHAGVVSAGVGAGVPNPERAVDNDLTNFAQFNSLATVSCPSALAVKLEQPAPAGY